MVGLSRCPVRSSHRYVPETTRSSDAALIASATSAGV